MASESKTMKALVYNGPWDMTLEILPRPMPKQGEVLLRIGAVGICSSDIHGFSGESGRRAPGMVMGHEASGVVVAHGPGTSDPPIGAHVVVYNIIADIPPDPEEGDPSFLAKQVVGVNLGTRGAMAEYLTIPANNAMVIDAGVIPETGLLAEPLGVVTHGFRRLEDKNMLGSKLAIVGCGTIGLAAILYAGARGIGRIAALEIISAKLAKGAEYGATPVAVGPDEPVEPVSARVEAALGGRPDVVVDAVGSQDSLALCLGLVEKAGAVLLIGNTAKELAFPLQNVVGNEISLVGTYGFDKSAFADSLQLLPRLQDKLASFIEDHCSLEETPTMMTALAKGQKQALKVVINVGAT